VVPERIDAQHHRKQRILEDAMLTTLTIAQFPGSRIATVIRAVLSGFLANQVKQVFRTLKNRRDAAMLAEFDDRMLADIGLTRSDVNDAHSVPLWQDPTTILALRAGEKRRYRRGAPFGLSESVVASPTLVPQAGYGVPATNRPARYTV
jgi:uncharacterized protein YjiS (DUF1127 family)